MYIYNFILKLCKYNMMFYKGGSSFENFIDVINVCLFILY